MIWKTVSSLALKHEFELVADSFVRLEMICEKADINKKMQLISGCNTARPIDEWHEDYGDVLWWIFPIAEPPYCGSPLASDWPEYHTHWTPLVYPLLGEVEG